MITLHLRRIRQEKELSIRQLEKISGVSRSEISAIENGRYLPNLEILNRLANALELEPKDLYHWEKE